VVPCLGSTATAYQSNNERTLTLISKAVENEPNLSVGALITGIIIAIIAVLNAFGVNVTENQSAAIVGLIGAMIALPIVTGYLARFLSYAPSTVDEIVAEADQVGFNSGYQAGKRVMTATPSPTGFSGTGDDTTVG
jgi:hypothetical protein